MRERGAEFLECSKLLLDLVVQLFALLQWPRRGAGTFEMTPHQFVWIQVWCVAGQEAQSQTAFGRCDLLAERQSVVSH
jgi:hypothetical protein